MAKEYEISWINSDDVSIKLTGKIDLITGLNQRDESKVTDVPIESGGSVADHVYDEPITLEISAIVTNFYSDNERIKQNLNAFSEDVDVLSDGASSGLLDASDQLLLDLLEESQSSTIVKPGRPSAVFNEIRELKRKRTLFTVRSLQAIYENMIIQSISAREDMNTGEALYVRIKFKELKTSESEFEVLKKTVRSTEVPQEPTQFIDDEQVNAADTAVDTNERGLTPGQEKAYTNFLNISNLGI